MKRLVIFLAAAAVTACGGREAQTEKQVLESVRAAVGDVTDFEYSRVGWCPNRVNGARAAFVAAVGDTTAGDTAGMGGYFVEVMDDGTVGPAYKADGINSPSYDAQRIDRTYCDGRFVIGPQSAMRQLEEMNQGVMP